MGHLNPMNAFDLFSGSGVLKLGASLFGPLVGWLKPKAAGAVIVNQPVFNITIIQSADRIEPLVQLRDRSERGEGAAGRRRRARRH